MVDSLFRFFWIGGRGGGGEGGGQRWVGCFPWRVSLFVQV